MSLHYPLSGRRILIVEDEYFTAQETRRIVERAGGAVVGPFGEVPEVMAALSQPLDAAVIDIGLRGQTSYRLADALEARGVPYLFATATDVSLVPERFAGVPLLPKPFGGPDLVRLVAGLKPPASPESAG